MNKKILTGALAALTLGGALAATTALPASAAEHWRGGYDRGWRDHDHDRDRGWRGGDGAAAALLGLSLGAALSGGYGSGYYAPSYYAPPVYYAPRCRVELRWNPYWRGYDRVRVCY